MRRKFSIVVLAKILWFLFFLRFFRQVGLSRSVVGFWGVLSNDTFGYIDGAETFLKTGHLGGVFGPRMFGYTMPYLMFRGCLSPASALNAVLLMQLALSTIALFLLCLLVERFSRRNGAFYVGLCVYFAIVIVSFYDSVALTESFATSGMIISIYFLYRERAKRDLVLSGFFLAWIGFLRPVFFPVFALHLAYLAYRATGRRGGDFLKRSVVFLIPLILMEGTWVTGRYLSGAREHLIVPAPFVPTYTDPAKHTIALIRFLQAVGVNWHSQSHLLYEPNGQLMIDVKTSVFGESEIASLRRDLQSTQTDIVDLRDDVPREVAAEKNREISERLRAYTESIKTECPFHYYVKVPVKFLAEILFHSSTERMFGRYDAMSLRLKPFRLCLDFACWTMEVLAIIAVFWIPRKRYQTAEMTHLSLVFLYPIVFHAVVFRHPDFRYIIPVLPLALVLVAGRLRMVLAISDFSAE